MDDPGLRDDRVEARSYAGCCDSPQTGRQPERSGGGQPQAARRVAEPSNMRGLDSTVFVFTGGLGIDLESSARQANAGLARR